MFVLIWVTLLFPVGGTSNVQMPCTDGFCINLTDREITAEAGLCAVIPCSFSTPPEVRPLHMAWLKCESKQTCIDSDMFDLHNMDRFWSKGRVSLLEPNTRLRNCSFIINDLTKSDSGPYQLSLNGFRMLRRKYLFPMSATVSVTDLTQKPRMVIPPLRDGQQTTLTCIAPGLCSGSHPKIVWKWRGAGKNDPHIPGTNTSSMTERLTAFTHRHSSTLTFTAVATQHHGSKVTCMVSFTNNITTEKTVTLTVSYTVQDSGTHSLVLPWTVAAVSLIINVICIICLLIGWKKREKGKKEKKGKPNQEDRTYMSLQKTEPSPEYDTIGQQPH